jgi:hypothetical protein
VRGTPYLSKLESIASSAVRAADKVGVGQSYAPAMGRCIARCAAVQVTGKEQLDLNAASKGQAVPFVRPADQCDAARVFCPLSLHFT